MKPCLYSWLRKAKTISLLVLLATFTLGLAGCQILSDLSYSEPTPVIVKHVAEEINGLTQLWSRDDVYILEDNKTLDSAMGVGCFLGNLGKALKYDQMVCFDNETGEVKWQRESFSGGILAASPAGLFVARTSAPNTLSRYDLQSGKLIWQQKWFESNPIGLRFFNNQIQLITWKPGRDLWVYDIDGKVLKKINNTDAILTTPDVTYVSGTGLKAIETDTNEVLWDHIDTGRSYTPIITQDKIFYRSESNSGTVYALDRTTGELWWQVGDIVYSSSIAHSPEKQLVYALRKNGDLLAINQNTGEISNAAKFSSTPFLFVSGTARGYELAYDQEEQILLVSFGDGHQIFAFREE